MPYATPGETVFFGNERVRTSDVHTSPTSLSSETVKQRIVILSKELERSSGKDRLSDKEAERIRTIADALYRYYNLSYASFGESSQTVTNAKLDEGECGEIKKAIQQALEKNTAVLKRVGLPPAPPLLVAAQFEVAALTSEQAELDSLRKQAKGELTKAEASQLHAKADNLAQSIADRQVKVNRLLELQSGRDDVAASLPKWQEKFKEDSEKVVSHCRDAIRAVLELPAGADVNKFILDPIKALSKGDPAELMKAIETWKNPELSKVLDEVTDAYEKASDYGKSLKSAVDVMRASGLGSARLITAKDSGTSISLDRSYQQLATAAAQQAALVQDARLAIWQNSGLSYDQIRGLIRDEFAEGKRLQRDGQTEEAMEHLQRAKQLDAKLPPLEKIKDWASGKDSPDIDGAIATAEKDLLKLHARQLDSSAHLAQEADARRVQLQDSLKDLEQQIRDSTQPTSEYETRLRELKEAAVAAVGKGDLAELKVIEDAMALLRESAATHYLLAVELMNQYKQSFARLHGSFDWANAPKGLREVCEATIRRSFDVQSEAGTFEGIREAADRLAKDFGRDVTGTGLLKSASLRGVKSQEDCDYGHAVAFFKVAQLAEEGLDATARQAALKGIRRPEEGLRESIASWETVRRRAEKIEDYGKSSTYQLATRGPAYSGVKYLSNVVRNGQGTSQEVYRTSSMNRVPGTSVTAGDVIAWSRSASQSAASAAKLADLSGDQNMAKLFRQLEQNNRQIEDRFSTYGRLSQTQPRELMRLRIGDAGGGVAGNTNEQALLMSAFRKEMDSEATKLTYSPAWRLAQMGQAAVKPVNELYAAVLLGSPDSVIAVTQGPKSVVVDVAKKLAIPILKYEAEHPSRAAREIADAQYARGYDAYQQNYAIVERYRRGEQMTEADARAFMANQGEYERMAVAVQLIRDINSKEYNTWKAPEQAAAKKAAEIGLTRIENAITKVEAGTASTAFLAGDVIAVFGEAKKSLQAYEPYAAYERAVTEIDSRYAKVSGAGTRQLGGVKLGPPSEVLVDPDLGGIEIDDKTGAITLISRKGKRYSVDATVRPEIMRSLLYLWQTYGDLSDMAFTLTIDKPVHDQACREIESLLTHSQPEVSAAASEMRGGQRRTVRIGHVSVPNRPYCLGKADYANTVIGKVALEADLALKYLSEGLEPSTRQAFKGSDDYEKAVADQAGSFHVRMWLYCKASRLEMDDTRGRLSIGVDVGIQTQSVEYVDGASQDQMKDTGPAPQCVQTMAKALEQDFDSIADRVPAWQQLKEAYRGLLVLRVMERFGIRPQVVFSEKQLRSHAMPAMVEGLAGCKLEHDGRSVRLAGITIGGVDWALWNTQGHVTTRNRFFPELYRLGASEGGDVFSQAALAFLDWRLDDTVQLASNGLAKNPSNWELLNLRANASVCKAFAVPKPRWQFDPVSLPCLLGEDMVRRLLANKWDVNLAEEDACSKALTDYEAAATEGRWLVLQNFAIFNKLREVPAEKRFEKALATQNGDEKLRLHRESAELFMATGSYSKAAKRLEFICYKRPDDLATQVRLTEAHLAQARKECVTRGSTPRVLVLPLRNVAANPKDTWLSRGWCHLLEYAASKHRTIDVASISEVWHAIRVLGFDDNELYAFGKSAQTIAEAQGVGAQYVLTGSFVKFGNAIKFDLELTSIREADKPRHIEVKGSLAEPRVLVRALHDEVAFELKGNVNREEPYDDLPTTAEDIEVWCTVRAMAVSGRTNEAEKYMSTLSDEGNHEALLAHAEFLLASERFAEARRLLMGAKVNDAKRYRLELILGECAFILGEKDVARKHLVAAEQANPRCVKALLVRRQLTDREDERQTLNEKLMELGCKDPTVYIDAVGIWLGQGDAGHAVVSLRRMLATCDRLPLQSLLDVSELLGRAVQPG